MLSLKNLHFSISGPYSIIITPIVNNPGLYFDPIGSIKYYNNYWNILTFSETSYIEPHLLKLKKILDSSKEICGKHQSTKLQTDCFNVLSPLESMFIKIENNLLSLSHITNNQTRLKRSAWFGIGGPILKQLFGSLDEDDAKTFTDAINNVQDDQRHLASLMKDNIHVITSTISTFNNSISKLNANEQSLNDNMNKLNAILDSISENNNKLQVSSHLALTFSALESSLIILETNLNNLINAILFGKLNIVHPSILSPIQLYKEFTANNIVRNFPISVDLNNIHLLLDVAEISSYFIDTKLVFVVKIPIALLAEYNLYHVYALPSFHDVSNLNSFAMIHPTAKYLSITEDKLTYSVLSDLSECKVLKGDLYLCKLGNIYSSVANPICETILLSEHVDKLPNCCDYKIVIGNVDIWQKLSNNRWIYVQSDVTKLSVNCNNKIQDYDITGTGIFNLPKHCKAYHKLLQFIPSSDFITQIYIPTPSFNIIDDDCCSIKRFNDTISHLSPIKLSHVNLDQLQYAAHRLNQFNDDLTKIENQPYHVKYNFYFSILTTLVSVTVLSFISYKMYKCLCPSRKNCCIQVFNSCYNTPRTSVRARTEIELKEMEYDTNSTNSSPSSPRRNLEF